MLLAFDLAKDAENIVEHGISLADASKIDWSTEVHIEDDRHDYGEIRMIGLGLIGHRVYVIVYVDRGEARRIISLRKANKREAQSYAEGQG